MQMLRQILRRPINVRYFVGRRGALLEGWNVEGEESAFPRQMVPLSEDDQQG